MMKRIAEKILACVCGLLIFCSYSNAHAASQAGTWKGLCKDRDIKITLSQTGAQVSGTLELGRETFTVEATTDNASDNSTLTLEGTGGDGIFPHSCMADFSITAPGQMTGTVTVRSMLGLRIFSGDAALQNLEQLVDFSLIIGHVQEPSNIYLFFSIQDGNGNPVTGLKEQDFAIYEDDEPISLSESSQTIIPNPSLYTMATVLLLDLSGSILESQTLTPLKNSAKDFLGKVAGEEGQEVAVYLFDGREKIRKLVDFTKDVSALQTAIDMLNKDAIKNDSEYDISTNLNGAVLQGLAALDNRSASIEMGELFTGTLVTFTDGTDRASRVTNDAAVAAVTSSPNYSFTIGLGAEIDEAHLKNIGKSGFAYADNGDELNAAFDQIATAIRSESGKRYILGYCTPQRQGDHKVTLRVKGHPGALSYAFSADGFSGGCDPTAIPDGMGPGDSGQCLFKIEPDTVRKRLLTRRSVLLTITSDAVQFSKNTTVSIDGISVLSTRFRNDKLRVRALISPKLTKQAYNVTVINGLEKIICFDALTVK